MIWLEMSRDSEHGGDSWGFSHCLWAPTVKQNSSGTSTTKWPFWENLMKVKAGDIVLHLRGAGTTASFVGYSIAETDGFITDSKPPIPGKWGYAQVFYKVLLKDYRSFVQPITLSSLFSSKKSELIYYFNINKEKAKKDKRSLFYVQQGGRLQCLNGAYLTEIDDALLDIILRNTNYQVKEHRSDSLDVVRPADIETSESIRNVKARIGQNKFSDNVRSNYAYRCCFPDCNISENNLLVGAHIARWADVPELRGEVSNGLCLCLIHDRAFELGYFTLSKDYSVIINANNDYIQNSEWFQQNIKPYQGRQIRLGFVHPSQESLSFHWERIGYKP